MKKAFTLGTIVAMATLTMVTSCEPDPWYNDGWRRGDNYYDDYGRGSSSGTDQQVTYYLDGTWRGNTHWYNTWTGHNYTNSEVAFIPQSYRASTGTGYWVDYYDNYQGGYYIFNNITWTVTNGVISIHFVEENSNVQIYDYTISDRYFDGYIYVNNNDVEFKLDYITAPYYGSWDSYTAYDYGTSAKSLKGASNDETSNIIWDRSSEK